LSFLIQKEVVGRISNTKVHTPKLDIHKKDKSGIKEQIEKN